MNMTMFIAATSFHEFSEIEYDRLRTDNRALSCIRNWDRNASIARIMFLTFHLNARKIIAHVSKMTEETKVITAIQKDLHRLIQAEFPHKFIKEVRRESIASSSIIFGDAKSNNRRIVNEVRVWFVKTPRKTLDNDPRVCLEGSILYVSFEEYFGETYVHVMKLIVDEMIAEVIAGNWKMTNNPMTIERSTNNWNN